MLQVTEGDPGPSAIRGLRPALVDHGMFLPCSSHPEENLTVEQPDLSGVYVDALVSGKRWLSKTICELSFEPATNIDWKPGQFINVRREEDGIVRSYSIASVKEEDYLLTIHVKRVDNGLMSNWLLDDVAPGDIVSLRGPVGSCFYDVADLDQDILMLGTGSGLAPLIGICRDALRSGHRGKVSLFHGARAIDGLYLREQLHELAATYSNFEYRPCLSEGDEVEGVERGRVVELAFESGEDRSGSFVYLCGVPDMVYDARVAAVAAGVRRKDIRSDPFEPSHGAAPRDKEKIRTLQPQPGLWAELDEGPGLSAVLTMFYDLAYEDSRLAPFFHKVTKRRAIEQQYSFLADLFTGEANYFGLRPFNAHHWMVISDELFDYREMMMEACMREYGLTDAAIRAWGAVHERFRREIVKATARGLIVDGEEQPILPPETVRVEFAGICDGCVAEMSVGETGTFVPRTGQLFCSDCAVRSVAIASGG